MANIFKKILNFLLFRFSFKIKTQLDFETTCDTIQERLKIDSSFVEPAFENNEFAFSYQKFIPKFHNYGFIAFEGQIIEKEKKVEINFKAVAEPIFVSLVFIYPGIFFYFYFTNFDGFRESPFSNPLLALIPIIVIYIIYLVKISEVKSLFKRLFLI